MDEKIDPEDTLEDADLVWRIALLIDEELVKVDLGFEVGDLFIG